jgi:hypothetical protein
MPDSLLDFTVNNFEDAEVVSKRLSFLHWSRISTRNTPEKNDFSGYTGTITFRGKLGRYMGIIKSGEQLHIGKNSTFGLGKYKIIYEQ